MPVSATVWPINTSAQFQPTINGMSDSDILDIAPGTYFVHDLTFLTNITIESNQTLGGTAENTILDGQYIPSQFGIIGNQTGHTPWITIKNLTLQNGNTSASDGGGAVSSHGDIVVYTSNFINDSAGNHYGGALSEHSGVGDITVFGSTFTNCSSGIEGGAIYDNAGSVFVNSSSFVTDYATTSAGAIYGSNGVNATFSRFSSVTSGDNSFIETNGGDIYAPNNWWGTNNPRISTIFEGGGTYTINPWLNLTITATPMITTTAQTSTIQAYLKYYNDSTIQSGNFIPTNGMPVTFTVFPATSGSVNPSSGTFANMLSQTIFTPQVGGPVAVNATVDSTNVWVNFDLAPSITAISPPNSLNTAAIPVTITGSGFYNTTTIWPTVNLTRSGYSNITLTGVSVSSVTSINGIIPAGIPAGVWNIVVTNPDGLEGITGSVTFDAQISTPKNNNNGRPSYGQPESNPDNGYTGPQPASQGGAPVKPAVVRQEAPPETTPISPVITALAPVQNPTILAMVILTLQEFQFWLILAVIIIILIAILRRWWIKRQVL
ncbi:MAG: hypothetical protein WCE65_02245 [Methanoregula sp.]